MLPIVVLFDSMQPRTRDTLINGRFVNKLRRAVLLTRAQTKQLNKSIPNQEAIYQEA